MNSSREDREKMKRDYQAAQKNKSYVKFSAETTNTVQTTSATPEVGNYINKTQHSLLESARQKLRNEKYKQTNVVNNPTTVNVKNVLEELNLKLKSIKGGKKQVVTRKRYEDRTVEELRHQAATRKISGCNSMKKAELIKSLRN